jgi:hypothetical protein
VFAIAALMVAPVEAVILDDDDRPRLAGVVVATGGGPHLTALHPSIPLETALMKASSSAACELEATRLDCRDACAAKAGDLVSGTQIWMGRRPWARSRSRWACTFCREALEF